MNYDGGYGEYDQGGGQGAGGYFAGGGNAGSPSSQDEQKRNAGRDEPLSTVNIRMLMMGEVGNDDKVTVDGKPVSKVAILGKVTKLEHKETAIIFVVDDGTAQIEVQRWAQDEESAFVKEQNAALAENAYVHVVGKFRTLTNRKQIHAFSVRPITDHNEITNHFLQVIFEHYQRVKGPLSRLTGAGLAGGIQNVSGNYGGSAMGFTNAYAGGAGGGGMMGGPQDAMDPQSRAVHDAFAADMSSDSGLSISAVAARLKMSVPQVTAVCQNLVNEGFMYSTIDEQHYKSTGSYA